MVTSTQDQNNTTLLPDYPNTGSGIWGCYKSGATETNLYRSTWTFPGTWLNIKTGEISYSPKDSSKTVWYSYDKKFCIPGDAQNVNTAWWNAYRNKQLKENGILDQTSIADPAIEDECHYQTSSDSVYNKTSVSESDITWNIHAKAKNFGYFDWNINIDCFFAVNSDPLKADDGDPKNTTTPKECLPPPGKDPDDPDYRVRSDDQEEMFPNENGEASTGSYGRTPGYNWSEYAVNNKNTDYKSNPPAYVQQLQLEARNAKLTGNEIYTVDKLDYEFNLTPQVLRQMRKDAAGIGGNNYTSFSDSGFSISSGVGRYKSQKIRSLAGDHKIPNGPELNCNNMLHYGSSACDPVHN